MDRTESTLAAIFIGLLVGCTFCACLSIAFDCGASSAEQRFNVGRWERK
jgi:hypothetical protein